jgi:hypothetical protein
MNKIPYIPVAKVVKNDNEIIPPSALVEPVTNNIIKRINNCIKNGIENGKLKLQISFFENYERVIAVNLLYDSGYDIWIHDIWIYFWPKENNKCTNNNNNTQR